MRKSSFLLGFITAVVAATYTVAQIPPAPDPTPAWCYVRDGEEPPHPNCGSCTSHDCPDCDSGTCPGDKKYCNTAPPKYKLVQEAGWLKLIVSSMPCFQIRDCETFNGEPCGPNLSCGPGGTPEYSSTTRPHQRPDLAHPCGDELQ